MPTCPNGHQSVSDDWCEVCGHRMAAGAGAPTGAVPPPPPPPPPAYGYPGPGGPGPGGPGAPGGPVPPPPGAPGGFGPGGDPNATAQAELCPQCRTPREHMAPFCEECRWNFLTNTATSYTPVAPQSAPRAPQGPGPQGPPPGLNLPPGFQSPPVQGQPPQGPPMPPQPMPGQPMPGQPMPGQQPDPFDYQGSRPSQVNRPAEPLGADPTHLQAPPRPPMPQTPQAPQAPQGFPAAPPQAAPPQPAPPQPRADDDWMLSPPSMPQPPAPPAPAPGPGPMGPGPMGGPPPQFQQGPPPVPQPQAPQAPQAPQPQVPQSQLGWTAVIGPDREYFMAMMQRSGPEAGGLNLPAYSPEQHIPLQGNQISIGRRRHSTGESPDIDLSVPPEDPGVSHQHAVLVAQPDGSWAVVDQNSTNGTTINGSPDPIQPYVPVQLQEGDRVHVGAWTTITVRRG
ncbi:FHA domain-containing protein [Streptomyces sp. SKN60]|uniref:FHA domain-containing protein n=1 Tax=Streptomyces sp. SKN60 TaxID=2855506 RepID=UPI0022451971|nr:FHA domain-containing protein [Streptomyces sp. SKN60]MCX2179912.1 FHA domain-containing protein [Streptomyces sp. SKN60]